MSLTGRTITREIGAALAVLGLYVFMLLVPLHQAAGLQRDLAGLGFATSADWSICTPLAIDEDGNKRDGQPLCGVLALANSGLADLAAAPVLPLPSMDGTLLAIPFQIGLRVGATHLAHHARAPPVIV